MNIPTASTFPTRPSTDYARMTDVALRTRRFDVIERLTTGWAQRADQEELDRLDAELNHPLRGRSYLI